jgi:hypothetical protein
MIELLLGPLFLISLIFACFLSCIGCWCCWFSFPCLTIFFGARRFGFGGSGGHWKTSPTQISTSHQYSAVANNEPTIATTTAVPSASSDLPLAEAYIVPPLTAAATVVSVDHTTALHHGLSGTNAFPREEEIKESEDRVKKFSSSFHDVWAAVLFLINLGIIFYLTWNSFHHMKVNPEDSSTSSSSAGGEKETTLSSLTTSRNNILMLLLYGVGFVLFIAFAISLMMKLIIRYAEKLIEITIVLNIAFLVMLTISSLLSFNILSGLLFGFLALYSYWFYNSVRDRIPFASAILSTSCIAIEKNFIGILTTILTGSLIQVIWISFWSIAFYSILYSSSDSSASSNSPSSPSSGSSSYQQQHRSHHSSSSDHTIGNEDSLNGDDAVNGLLLTWLVFSFYWGFQVINYLVGLTCSGSVACWWFLPQHPAPVRSSFFRSITTSFGSVCFGSLLVAILQTLRFLLTKLRNDRDQRNRRNSESGQNLLYYCFLCILETLVIWIEALVVYFNRYAFAYIAAYGDDFVSAGHKVVELFDSK